MSVIKCSKMVNRPNIVVWHNFNVWLHVFNLCNGFVPLPTDLASTECCSGVVRFVKINGNISIGSRR